MNDELIRRFWDKVNKAGNEDCWLWTASVAGKGYGQLKLPGQRRQTYAHRLSYEIHCGEIAEGQAVLHECDNPRCVNPKHLFLGTSGDNAQDMMRKGRHLYGERNTEHRLTEADVNRILDMLDQGVVQRHIANEFGVGQMTVSRIGRGERWRHVWLKRRGISDPT
jgi:HNH endonuclease